MRDTVATAASLLPSLSPPSTIDSQDGATVKSVRGSLHQLALGTLLGGRYELTRPVGQGGYGAVYEVLDRQTGNRLALKYAAESSLQGFHGTRFIREYRVASRLRHPLCVRSHDWGRAPGGRFFTMDLLEGGALQPNATPRMPMPLAVGLTLQAFAALDSLHDRGIVHRDIKPQNLLLSSAWAPLAARGEGLLPSLCVSDFGVAKFGDLSEQPVVGSVTGTPMYIPPEAFTLGSVDPRTDLYALGVVLFQLLTGEAPWENTLRTTARVEAEGHAQAVAERLRATAGLPERLRQAVQALLASGHRERPRTAAQAYDMLLPVWSAAAHGFALPEFPPLRGSPYLASSCFVGRDAPMQAAQVFLRETLQRASGAATTEGASCLMSVQGVPGVGKSTFLWRVLGLAESLGARVLVGQCKAEVHAPYESMQAMARQLRGWGEAAAPPVDGSGQWARSLRMPLASDPEYALLNQPAADGLERVQQEELRSRLFLEQILVATLRAGMARPLCLVLEDLQWADASTLGLLLHLVRGVATAQAQGAPVQVSFVVTHRPAEGDSHPMVKALYEGLALLRETQAPPCVVRLAPLPPEVARTMVAHVLMQEETPALGAFAERILAGADKTPLYVEQVLRLLLMRGELTQTTYAGDRWTGRWNLEGAAASTVALPETVQAAVGERAARLAVGTQALLALASVVARSFAVPLLAEASTSHPHEILDALDEAASAGFVVAVESNLGADVEALDAEPQSDAAWRFAHDRYREAIYGRLPAAQAQTFHGSITAALLRVYGDMEASWEPLAYHHRRAQSHTQASHFGLKAAVAARSNGAFERASSLYNEALDSATQARVAVAPEIFADYADVCTANGEFEQATLYYRKRIETLTAGTPECWDVQLRLAELAHRAQDYQNAVEPLEALLASMQHPVPTRQATLDALGTARLVWLLLRGLAPNSLRGRALREDPASEMLVRASSSHAEVTSQISFRKAVWSMGKYGMETLRQRNAYSSLAYSSMAFGFASVGLGKVSRNYSALAEEDLTANPRAAASLRGQVRANLLGAMVLRGQYTPAMEAHFGATLRDGIEAGIASGDIQRMWMLRHWLENYLRFTGRLAAQQVAVEAMRSHFLRYGRQTLLDLGRAYFGAMDLFWGTHHRALVELQASTQSGKKANPMMELQNACMFAFSDAIAHPHAEAPRPDLVANAVRDVTWFAREKFVSPSIPLLGLNLGAAALALRNPAAGQEHSVRELQALARQVRMAAHGNAVETSVYVAACGALAYVGGDRQKGCRLLHQGAQMAQAQGMVYHLALIHQLCVALLPEGSPAHQAAGGALHTLWDAARALPVNTAKQLDAGDFGPPIDPACLVPPVLPVPT